MLDGGDAPIGVESTILSLIHDPPRVLRPGGIAIERLRAIVPDLRFSPNYLPEDAPAAPAPGGMLRHYSPKAPVLLFEGANDAAVHRAMRAETGRYDRVGLLASDAEAAAFADLNLYVERLGPNTDEAARRLFAGLRTLDQLEVDVILARAPSKAGLGLAVWDRLLRASAGGLITV